MPQLSYRRNRDCTNDFNWTYELKTYLGCILEETLSGESMAYEVISKVNARLKFLHRKNKYLTLDLRRLLGNVLIQSRFDYACSAW